MELSRSDIPLGGVAVLSGVAADKRRCVSSVITGRERTSAVDSFSLQFLQCLTLLTTHRHHIIVPFWGVFPQEP